MSTTQPSGPFVSSLRFAAVLTAIGCARMFVEQTLSAWQVPTINDDAVLIASELVTNAVRATGNTDPHPSYAALAQVSILRVRLSIQRDRLVIEVWDNSRKPPVLQQQREDAVDGRGLFLVHMLSEQWGTYFPKVGGKVVWAELALSAEDAPPQVIQPNRSAPSNLAASSVAGRA